MRLLERTISKNYPRILCKDYLKKKGSPRFFYKDAPMDALKDAQTKISPRILYKDFQGGRGKAMYREHKELRYNERCCETTEGIARDG